MSNFLEKLKTSVFDCEPNGEIINGRLEVLTIIDTLGENARKILFRLQVKICNTN